MSRQYTDFGMKAKAEIRKWQNMPFIFNYFATSCTEL